MQTEREELKQKILKAEAEASVQRARDPYRFGFHLMPPSGWMNDPNGLCWYQGEYHVFYQYSPLDAHRGQIFWGHWSSPDMLSWTQHPVFLYPTDAWDKNGVYSGSGLAEKDGLYLYYTGNVKHPGNYDYIYEGRGHNVGLAITRDGVTADSNRCILENKDYPQNLSCHVRDPKVWKQGGAYYMVLGARTRQDVGEILVFTSEDKLHWKHLNTIQTPQPFGFMWECPDLFCVDGQWIVMTSPQGIAHEKYRYQNVYSCGYFPLYGDFRSAYTLGDYQELDAGFDFYAPQTFEAPDGRRILLGWMGMPDADYTNPTADWSGWQHGMSVPRELHWNGERLTAQPIKELQQLRTDSKRQTLRGTATVETGAIAELRIRNTGEHLRIAIGSSAVIEWSQGLLSLTLSEQAGYGRNKRYIQTQKLETLHLLMDTSSLELFVNGGEQTMTTRFYPQGEEQKNRTITLHGEGEVQSDALQPMTFHWAQA